MTVSARVVPAATLSRFATRASVNVGGGDLGAMQASRLIGSSGESSVPFLPVPLGMGFPAQFRRVPLEGMALASVGGQAGRKRVLRKCSPCQRRCLQRALGRVAPASST